MDVVVTSDFRFCTTPDGAVWTRSVYGNDFWQRYLDAFESVKILARAESATDTEKNLIRVDGGAVEFVPISNFMGTFQYLIRGRDVRRVCEEVLENPCAIILRVPSVVASVFFPIVKRSGRPFGLEVCGDPYSSLAPGCIEHPLRPLLRWKLTRELKEQCGLAIAAAYVTQEVLQKRYPSHREHPAVSDVELNSIVPVGNHQPPTNGATPVTLSDRRRRVASGRNPSRRRVIFVGSLTQPYKGLDVLLDAIADGLASRLDLDLVVLGDGKHRHRLETLATVRGLADRTSFLGEVLPDQVVQELDRADLFVLPSRTEGLPRALIEAMSRGLPCIGSSVGGIPELLAPEDLVPPGNVRALREKIWEVLTDPTRVARMSERNLQTAQEYLPDRIRPRRREFYRELRSLTEEWFQRHPESVLAGSMP